MSDLSLRLRITAIDNATKALERIGKSSEYWLNKDKREQERHEYWKTNLAQREAEKRIRIEERANKQRRQQLLKSEQDFRTSAQRLALYTTAPTTIMSTLGMRAFMQMEQRQIRMKMLYGEQSKDMEKFAQDYALKTAFTISNTTDLLEVIALGKETLGIKSNEEIKDLSKVIGDVILAYAPSAEAQTGVMLNIKQMMNTGRLETVDARQMARWGLNLDRLAKIVGVQKKGEMWSSDEVIKIFKLTQKTDEVQTNMIENAKTFTQAWGAAGESLNLTLEGLGKTLNKQFDLTDNTKIFAGLLQKISSSLKEDEDNLTKGMASYLTMLALTVAPMLMLIGHWRKISFLIGESNMKGTVLRDRLIMTTGVMSGLYLATVDWGDLMKQYEEQGFLKTTLNNLDKVIALMMVGGALYKAIQALYTFWIAKEARLTALAVIRAAATNPKALIAVGAATAAVGGTYLIANAIGQKSGEQVNQDMGYDPLKRMFGNENQNYASGRNIEMLANLQSQPKVEVVNNINVDKSGNVSVETKTKDKNTYTSPYSAPVMSDFSLGY